MWYLFVSIPDLCTLTYFYLSFFQVLYTDILLKLKVPQDLNRFKIGIIVAYCQSSGNFTSSPNLIEKIQKGFKRIIWEMFRHLIVDLIRTRG